MNITTIIPIHEYDDKIEKFFNQAINTVLKQDKIEDRPEILVVFSEKLFTDQLWLKRIKKTEKDWEDKLNIRYLKNDGNSDFQSQINYAVKNVNTEWFNILEFDDELSLTYYYNVLNHISKLENVDLILPIIVEVNNDNEALKLTNDTVWSKQFVGENGEMGYLNANSLNQYSDFKFSGGIFKKSTFEGVGGLKSNIKLSFIYEFFLRMLNNGSIIYTMPKIGVKHLTTREGSLFNIYKNTMSIEEKKFWFSTAKKESNFFNDRVIDIYQLKEESE